MGGEAINWPLHCDHHNDLLLCIPVFSIYKQFCTSNKVQCLVWLDLVIVTRSDEMCYQVKETGGRRKFHSEDFYDLHCSPSIIRVIRLNTCVA